MSRLLVALSLFLCVSLTAALGREITLEEVKTRHWNSVDNVFLCGNWVQSNISGTYRIIHAEVYGSSVLFVEWLKGNVEEGKWGVAFEYGFPEINNDHSEITLENLECRANENGAVLTALASFGHLDSMKQVSFQLGHEFGSVEIP